MNIWEYVQEEAAKAKVNGEYSFVTIDLESYYQLALKNEYTSELGAYWITFQIIYEFINRADYLECCRQYFSGNIDLGGFFGRMNDIDGIVGDTVTSYIEELKDRDPNRKMVMSLAAPIFSDILEDIKMDMEHLTDKPGYFDALEDWFKKRLAHNLDQLQELSKNSDKSMDSLQKPEDE